MACRQREDPAILNIENKSSTTPASLVSVACDVSTHLNSATSSLCCELSAIINLNSLCYDIEHMSTFRDTVSHYIGINMVSASFLSSSGESSL